MQETMMNDSPEKPYASNESMPGVGGSESIEATAKIGMTITFGLASGIVFITAIIAFLVLQRLPEDASLIRFEGDDLLFLGIGSVITLGALPAAVVIPRLMRNQAFSQIRGAELNLPRPIRPDTELPPTTPPILPSISGSTLVGQALCEGPAITNAILMMIDENFAHLIPIVIGLIGVVLQLPTPGKIAQTIEEGTMPR